MDNLLDRMAALEHTLQKVKEATKRLEQRERATRRRLRLWQSAAAALVSAALLLAPVGRVTAQGGGSGNSLATQVAALQTAVANLQTQVTNLQTALNNESATRQNGDAAALGSARSYTDQQAVSTLASAKGYTDGAVAFEALIRAESDNILLYYVMPLADTFLAPNRFDRPYFSRVGDDITIEGANLHIVNGLGATNGFPAPPSFDPSQTVVNGVGNLIVGYNESRGSYGPDDRSGSHNLVVGSFQNFSSFGGLVAGQFSTISGPYASVSGGISNTASGYFSSVSGGEFNTASGGVASVSDGFFNIAPLEYSWAGGTFFSP
jgi:hypothetical protein